MKPTRILDETFPSLAPVLRTAFIKTLEAWLPPLRHLPPPVRFRASGALRAWLAVLDTLPSTANARSAIGDPAVSPQSARIEFVLAIQTHIQVYDYDHDAVAPMVQMMLSISCDMLAFWLRPNALYEPTLVLGGLLGGIDISQDLPLQLLQPPVPTLCIVPPWQQRHHCADASAIMVFTHDATPEEHPAKRTITLLVQRPSAESIAVDELWIPVKDESTTLATALARATESTRREAAITGTKAEDIDAADARWKQVLDYTVKVLLYLNLDDSAQRAYRPYAAAPKEFPGLGRRKREAKLAEVEQLYDRIIVGPAHVADWAGEHAGQLGAHGQLSAHWRRGHLRLQPHGPQQSLRKIMFIKPTIVRADRLADAGAAESSDL